jgi:hypothetical protein
MPGDVANPASNHPIYPPGPGYQPTTTSVAAAIQVAPTTDEAYQLILAELAKRPMTPDEIAVHFNWSPFYARPRCTELHKNLGLIELTGIRRPSLFSKKGTMAELRLRNYVYPTTGTVTSPQGGSDANNQTTAPP